MSLTLESLQAEMHSSFDNINERTDRILLGLNAHVKETESRFREVDRRFDEVDRRFDEVDRKFDKLTRDIVAALSPYFIGIEKMLSNHEDRITALEKRH